MAQTHGAERGLSRFEGFTDAVFAIALTLLIVEIKPPGSPQGPQPDEGLFHAIFGQWREFLTLLVSFFSIGVYWLQHHYTGRLYTKSDHYFGLLNLGFLFGVTVLPYPLQIWCTYLGTPHEADATVVLTAGMLLPGVFWIGKWLYALPPGRVLDPRLDRGYLRGMTARYIISVGIQALAVPVAFIWPRAAAVLSLGVSAFYLLAPPRPQYKEGQRPSEEERAST
jgi:uncharacterized membrane protein